ncbi:unnamed protein product [Cladocopium goreaui]|uniref:Uncharacterized protein n=1 Tax=Cladocopium goreaui TaxID=2562237 RepID=A0A9P1GCV2_9DINO|nr:unnamed protein product [Cladocopium goreaui]
MGDSEEDICARCSLNPLEVSLVLICNHRLCLACARKQMQILDCKSARSGGKGWDRENFAQASCPICRSVTQVEAGAAQQILSVESRELDDANPHTTHAQSLSVSSLSLSPLEQPSIAASGYSQAMARRITEGTACGTPCAPQNGLSESPGLSKVLPKPRNPVPSSCSLRSPLCPLPEMAQELQTCGQCQVEAADVRCWQCDEFFCQSCYKKIHHVGRMKEHRSTLLADGKAASVRSAPIQLSSRQTLELCMQHGEPFQFFCLDCAQCLCAECAVQRKGCVASGHDVQNAKRAFHQVSGSIPQLLEAAAAELQKPSPKKELTQQLDGVHAKGKQDLKASFLNLEETLKAKEDLILKGVEEGGRIADQLLLAKARQCETKSVQILRLRESLERMSAGEVSGEIQKINLYIAAMKNLAALLPQSARQKLQPGSLLSELERISCLDAAELEDLASSNLRQMQDALKAKTSEVDTWTKELQESMRE